MHPDVLGMKSEITGNLTEWGLNLRIPYGPQEHPELSQEFKIVTEDLCEGHIINIRSGI